MKKLFLLFFCTLSLSSMNAQIDVKGWNNIPWGSSNEEIKTKENVIKADKRIKYHNHYCDYLINEFEFLNSKFEVRFQMKNETNKLNQVLLTNNEFEFSTKNNESKNSKVYKKAESLFLDLKKSMRDLYGKEATTNDTQNVNEVLWNFDSTSIKLTLFHNKFAKVLYVKISYSEN